MRRSCAKANNRDRSDGSLSPQPEPIYLAFSLLQLGIAVWANSLWLIGMLAVAVGLIHFVVIPRKERYLEKKFGAVYLDYQASVRPWL